MDTSDKFENLVINDRFVINKIIGEGSFGFVYSCTDILNPSEELVVKLSPHKGTAENEVNAIEKINNTAK